MLLSTTKLTKGQITKATVTNFDMLSVVKEDALIYKNIFLMGSKCVGLQSLTGHV